jgi:hypothetical protein
MINTKFMRVVQESRDQRSIHKGSSKAVLLNLSESKHTEEMVRELGIQLRC